MNIRSIGWNSIHGDEYSIRREPQQNVYMLILMKSNAVFTINESQRNIKKDTLVIYDSKTVQEYRADGGIFIYDWIMFDIEGDEDFFESMEIPLDSPMIYTDVEFFSGIIRNIANEFYSMGVNRIKMIDVLIKTLFIKISDNSTFREMIQQNADPHYSVLSELREKVYRNPQMKWNIDTMAADVNMSRSYFQHIYRESFGVSCMSDVISGKIEKAKEILGETSFTVAQVAFMCGYDNEEHFMRQFKKLVGVTPTAYRKRLRNI